MDNTKAYAADNTYWGPSLKSWDGSGQYYKFTVSTAGISEDIYLSLWTLSFSSSVAELKVEWAGDVDRLRRGAHAEQCGERHQQRILSGDVQRACTRRSEP